MLIWVWIAVATLAAENYKPQPGDARLKNAPAFIDSAKIGVEKDKPVLIIEGSLPTPCHKLRLDFNKPDAKRRIAGKAYTVVDSKAKCAQMLQPFSVKLPLQNVMKGNTYAVIVNEQEIAKVTIP